MDRSQRHCAEWKKEPILKGHTLYESIYAPFLKGLNYSGGEKMTDYKGEGGSGRGFGCDCKGVARERLME